MDWVIVFVSGFLGGGAGGAAVAWFVLRNGSGKAKTEVNLDGLEQARSDVLSTLETVMQEELEPILRNAATVVIPLPSEETKGRLIGREGRNIRVFEELTGVDLVIDETPEAVLVSSFDPWRRTVAHLTLVNLVADQRIYPKRIEEVYTASKEGLQKVLERLGREVLGEAGVKGETTEHLAAGKLVLKTEGGVNRLDLVREGAWRAGLLAQELGFDAGETRRAVWRIELGTGEEVSGQERIFADAGLGLVRERPGRLRLGLDKETERAADIEKSVAKVAGVLRAVVMRSGKELRVFVTAAELSGGSDETVKRRVEEVLRRYGREPEAMSVTILLARDVEEQVS